MVTLGLAPGFLPPGRRVYAVGDVHGMAEKLAALHAAIEADLAARPVAAPLVVHVGDFIDRGPESRAVLARLVEGPAPGGVEVVNLRGNHEAMALAALEGEGGDAAALWMMNGAAATLRSWGVDPASPAASWAASVPGGHLRFLRELGLMHHEGGYLFVHAGLRPGVPLERQDPEDLVWIREPFLSFRGDFGAVVVHGHTPAAEPVVRPNRICIDTAAVFGGALTALVLEGDRMGFLQV